MASEDIEYICWNGDPTNAIAPHRPSIAQLGDNDKQDRPGAEPDPRYGITAAAGNQRASCVAAQAKVTDSVQIDVHVDGSSNHFVHSVTCPRDGFTTTDVTIARPSTGVVELTWAADSFPPALSDPLAGVTGTVPGFTSVEVITNGVRVNIATAAGAANLPFVVRVN